MSQPAVEISLGPEELEQMAPKIKAYKGWINSSLYDKLRLEGELRNRMCLPKEPLVKPAMPNVQQLDQASYSECFDGY
jgi:hypothetical protein